MIIESLLDRSSSVNQISSGWPGYWRISRVGCCQRAQVAEAQGLIAGGGSGWKVAADEGRLHEQDIVQRLKAEGFSLMYTLDDQIEVIAARDAQGRPMLIGHPDGGIRVADTNYMLEIKSKGNDQFPVLKKKGSVIAAYFHEYAQIQAYMASPEVKTWNEASACFYIAKNRSSGKLYEEIIRFDPVWWDEFLAKHFMPIVRATELGDAPETLPCSESAYTRQWCPYRFACESDTGTALPPAVADSQALEAIEKWRRVKELQAEIESLDEDARSVLREILIKSGVKKVTVDGVPVQIIPSKRSSISKDLLSELGVPEEVIKAATKITPIESLRIG